jgi:hypothetical protein
MVTEGYVVPPSGKRYALYRSAFSRMDITWENGTLTANAVVNPDIADKLQNRRFAKLRKD